MALAPVLLDDLLWTDMVESIRRRIPGVSEGVWTHHGPVDPGITLLELFAWLIEQRIFWIDQSSDDLTRALLVLAGERPREARAAATVLACVAPPARPFFELPPNVAFSLDSPDQPRAFTSTSGAVLAPIASAGIETGDGDRSADLRARRPVPLMRSDGAPSEIVIVLRLAHTGPMPAVTEKVSLLIELDTGNRVPSAWTAEAAGDVPAPAPITWSYSTTGGWRDFVADSVEDGTGGLRRSGIVRVPVPADWAPRGAASGALTPFAIRARTARSTFTYRPRLTAISWNVVRAEHWIDVTADPRDLANQARNWLKLPGQRLQLSADDPMPMAESVLVLLREHSGTHEWRPVLDFASGDRERRVFVVDRAARSIRFGDGISARIPVPDAGPPEIKVTYRAGAGAAGQTGAARTWRATFAHTTIDARNPVPAAGGAEIETIEEAARRTAATLVRNRRAVTRPDYEELACATPGVAISRALAAIGLHPLHPCARIPGAVTVFVVPFAPRADAHAWVWPDPSRVDAPVADPGALSAVRAHLDRARLVGMQVFVRPVRYRAVSVRVDVSASPARSADFGQRIGARVSRFLDPLVGGDAGEGLPFGEPVRPSALLRIAQQALQHEAIVDQVLVGLDGASATEACNDVAIGPHELAFLQKLDVTYRPAPSAGGLP